jgi:hypothetical protein
MSSQEHRRHVRRPEVEPLEAMTLLSPIAPGPSSPPSTTSVVAAKVKPSSQVTLDLKFRGVYQVILGAPDVGKDYLFQAGRVGSTHGLGTAGLDGSIHTPGFVVQGKAMGQLVAHTRRGDLYLQLVGPTTSGFSGLPARLSFTITGGTGKFANASGSGVVDVTLKPARNPSTDPHVIETGGATLTFHSNRVLQG